MILMRERSAEQRHDPVTCELVDGSLEAVNAVAQNREEAIHDRPPQLRVGSLGEVHRADHVSEEHRYLLALPIHIGPGVANPLR